MKKMTLRELQNKALAERPASQGLFWSSEISEVLEAVNIDTRRAVRKILRDAGQFRPLYDDVEYMTDAITDFFVDNATNILKADEVLNGRTYAPTENYQVIEDAYSDETNTENNLGQRHSAVNAGKTKMTVTPGDAQSETLENSKSTTQNNPRVLGSNVQGSSTTTTNTNIGDEFSSKSKQHREPSTQENEQLTAGSTTVDAVKDTSNVKLDAGRRNKHGMWGFQPVQNLASAEINYIMRFKTTLDFIVKLFISDCLIAVYDDDVNEYGYHYDEETGEDPGPTPPTPEIKYYDLTEVYNLNRYSTSGPQIVGGPHITPAQLANSNPYPVGSSVTGSVTVPEDTVIQFYSDDRRYDLRWFDEDGNWWNDSEPAGPGYRTVTIKGNWRFDWFVNI